MTAPLKVAMFVSSFPVLTETFILRQITGLLDLGHDVRIFADTRGDSFHPLPDRTTYMDLPPEMAPWELPVSPNFGRTWVPGAEKPIHNLRRVAAALPRFVRNVLVHPGLTSRTLKESEYGFQATSLSALYRLDKMRAQKTRFDILHAHFGPAGNSFRFAKELFRAPFIVSFHGYDFSVVPRKQGNGIYQKLFAAADAVTANSNYTRKQLENLGCASEKIFLLPVGLNPADFPYRARVFSEPLRIVTVGRLVEVKGHEYLIRAVHKLRREHPTVILDIVGDGPLRASLEQLTVQLNLQSSVVFHGALAQPEVRRVLHEAHIFVLPSVTTDGAREGQGLALQEAQACGLPVVATDHGALPEGLLPGKSGFLVPERDPDSLAERLSFLVKHSATWPAMGAIGREFAEKYYDIRKLNSRLLELYQRRRENAKQPA